MLSHIRSALAGRYVIERSLGRGATASVYAARDLKHGRRVALKVIEPDVVSTLGAGRFLQEIRTTAGLNHPHILPLFDSGDAKGCIYYTMPIVEGESLRARLDRETCMPLEVVLSLAHQVAGALSYAHAAGIVHRDIKPENILIDRQDHVWVADFGLARARASAMNQRLTTTGAAVGSPHYMSPEQAAGESDVDGRSDIYSFTCVVFEMLAGEPPFSAHTVPALLARHISEPAPAVRARCPELPPAADVVLQRGMSKDPADRFHDARDLVAALEQHDVDALPEAAARRRHGSQAAQRPPRRVRPWQAAGVVLLATTIVAVVLASDPLGIFVGRGNASTADSSRYVLLPVERVGDSASMNDEHLMRTAFARWRDVDVVGDADVARVWARHGSGSNPVVDYDDLGRELRAGRIVRTTVATHGDSIRVDAVMLDRTGHQIAAQSVRMARAEPRPDLHYARLADALLFAGLWQYDRDPPGTDSRAAQGAYLAGLAAITEWDLVRADSLFTAATAADAQFARALAWHAQVGFWMNGATAAMRTAAEQAIAAAEGESSRARLMAESLLAMGRDDYPAACDRYERLLEGNPRDYAATRGLADCHGLDQFVLPDPSSPTGWRFRSSGHRALLYHQRAFELLPASHRAYSHGRFLKLRQEIFYTGVTAHRPGLNAEGVRFNAEPEWTDTLELHPIERLDVSQLRGPVNSSAVAAVTHLRRIFFDVTAGWVAAYPRSPEALEAHAIAMELQGDTRALATLDLARSYVTDPEHAVNLSISEFWLMLKRAVPHAVEDIHAARLLADSIMEYAGPMAPPTARRMAAVAAATGRGHRAAALARRSAEPGPHQPLALAELGAVLVAYAAVGGYPDSLRVYERRVDAAITNLMRPAQVPQARGELLGRAASLALPEYRMSFMDAPGTGDYLIEAMSAHASGETKRVREIFDGIAESRSVFRPADIKFEVLLPEAWILLRMGDADAALRWFARTLDDFRYMEPGALEDVAAAGPLARVMLLRAEIESELGDAASARTWAAAVSELWTHADTELRPAARRAEALAARVGD